MEPAGPRPNCGLNHYCYGVKLYIFEPKYVQHSNDFSMYRSQIYSCQCFDLYKLRVISRQLAPRTISISIIFGLSWITVRHDRREKRSTTLNRGILTHPDPLPRHPLPMTCPTLIGQVLETHCGHSSKTSVMESLPQLCSAEQADKWDRLTNGTWEQRKINVEIWNSQMSSSRPEPKPPGVVP